MPMQRAKPWDSYRKVATQTASPAHLVLMLYDGAIGFLERALAGFDARRPRQRNQAVNNNILRAQAIIHEMNANAQHGGRRRNRRQLPPPLQLFLRPPARGQLQKAKRSRSRKSSCACGSCATVGLKCSATARPWAARSARRPPPATAPRRSFQSVAA